MVELDELCSVLAFVDAVRDEGKNLDRRGDLIVVVIGGTMLLALPGMREMRHMFVYMSCHPRTMVSPLKVISQPVIWKKTLHPAL